MNYFMQSRLRSIHSQMKPLNQGFWLYQEPRTGAADEIKRTLTFHHLRQLQVGPPRQQKNVELAAQHLESVQVQVCGFQA